MKKILEENHNYKQILNLILAQDGISRAQIARETNLNRSTISYIVKFFIDNNVVYETEEKVLTGGRASNLIKFNYNMSEVMIIDLQKRKLKILITNLLGEVIERFDYKIDHDDPDCLLFIQSSTRELLNRYRGITTCGLAIHGVVSNTRKRLYSPFYSHTYIQLESIFTNLGLNVFIENESNIYSNGIFRTMSTRSANMINIHIKDGIGCGQILNSVLQHGDNGYAGEIGHSIAVPGGKQCACGNQGCLELYVSEQSILNSISEVVESEVTIEQIPYLATSNKSVASILNDAIELLAIMLNDLLLFTDIQSIYITSDLYYEIRNLDSDLFSRLKSRNYIKPDIKIVNADLNMFTYGFANILLLEQFGL